MKNDGKEEEAAWDVGGHVMLAGAGLTVTRGVSRPEFTSLG